MNKDGTICQSLKIFSPLVNEKKLLILCSLRNRENVGTC